MILKVSIIIIGLLVCSPVLSDVYQPGNEIVEECLSLPDTVTSNKWDECWGVALADAGGDNQNTIKIYEVLCSTNYKLKFRQDQACDKAQYIAATTLTPEERIMKSLTTAITKNILANCWDSGITVGRDKWNGGAFGDQGRLLVTSSNGNCISNGVSTIIELSAIDVTNLRCNGSYQKEYVKCNFTVKMGCLARFPDKFDQPVGSPGQIGLQNNFCGNWLNRNRNASGEIIIKNETASARKVRFLEGF